MMGTIFDWLSGLLLVAGGFFVLVGGVGVIRMRD
jgi:multisubunit Na+/H+ antiporter MnhG subunit